MNVPAVSFESHGLEVEIIFDPRLTVCTVRRNDEVIVSHDIDYLFGVEFNMSRGWWSACRLVEYVWQCLPLRVLTCSLTQAKTLVYDVTAKTRMWPMISLGKLQPCAVR